MHGLIPSTVGRTLTIAIACWLALCGVLPQIHQAWAHGHGAPAAASCQPGDGHRHSDLPHPAQPDCPLCVEFAYAGPMAMPDPPAAMLIAWLESAPLIPPVPAAIAERTEIRWSLARGPPRT